MERVIYIDWGGGPIYQCQDCQMRPAVSVGWHDDGSVADAVCQGCADNRAAAPMIADGAILELFSGRVRFLKGYHNRGIS